jgi:hypothetical protein
MRREGERSEFLGTKGFTWTVKNTGTATKRVTAKVYKYNSFHFGFNRDISIRAYIENLLLLPTLFYTLPLKLQPEINLLCSVKHARQSTLKIGLTVVADPVWS